MRPALQDLWDREVAKASRRGVRVATYHIGVAFCDETRPDKTGVEDFLSSRPEKSYHAINIQQAFPSEPLHETVFSSNKSLSDGGTAKEYPRSAIQYPDDN